MTPLWKIARELQRVGRQLSWLAGRPCDRLRNARHERERARLVRQTAGGRKLADKAAIFVLYAPGGFPRSTFATLRHLDQKGYGVVAISNAPLTDADRAALAPHCTTIIERPNFGYDFGAYREGLAYLRNQGSYSHILLLNDSVWFPLFPNTDLIDRIEALDADHAGAVLYRNRRNPAKDHVQSYMMMFRGPLLHDPRFRRFWQDYQLTNNKWATVRLGEMGLSRFMREKGFTQAAVFEFDMTRAFQNALTDTDLTRIAAYETAVNTRLPRAPASQDAGWRKAMLARLSHPEATRYLLTTHPILSIQHLRLPLAKKDRHVNYDHWRAEFLHLVDTGALTDIDHDILAEIRARQ